MNAQNIPTAAMLYAINDYAVAAGRNWKSQLMEDWMSGKASGELQVARNSFGPSWLKKFNAVRAANSLLSPMNVVLEWSDDDEEYVVNFRGGREATAYFTNDLNDAIGTGVAMAQHKATWALVK